MDEAILPCIHISDRYITVESANFKIIDEVGHFTFTLKFMDIAETVQEGETAQNITISFK